MNILTEQNKYWLDLYITIYTTTSSLHIMCIVHRIKDLRIVQQCYLYIEGFGEEGIDYQKSGNLITLTY